MNAKWPWDAGLIVFILLVAGITRFYGIDRLSLWSDELWVVMESTRGSLWAMLQGVYYNDNHPPGYYLLSRYSQWLLGSSDFAIRLPSALAGVALVFVTYRVGKIHFSAAAGLVAAVLVTGSYQAIYYSQEARPNIFVALFALLSFHYFWQIVWLRDSSRKKIGFFAFSAAAAMYFHYAGLVFVLCLGLLYPLFWMRDRNSRLWFAGLKLFLPTVILFSPWLGGLYYDLMFSPPEYWQRTPDAETLNRTFWFLFGPDDARIFFYKAIFVIAIVYVMVIMARYLKQKLFDHFVLDQFAMVAFILAMVVLPVGLFFLKSSISQSAYNHRHFLFAIPLAALLAGFFISLVLRRLPEKKQHIGLLVVLAFLLMQQMLANSGRALYTANHFKQEYRESVRVVSNDKGFLSADHTMLFANLPFFDHYLKQFIDGRVSDGLYETKAQFLSMQALIASQQVTQFYYLEAPLIPGANEMVTEQDLTLANHYQPLCRTRFARTQVIKFSVINPRSDSSAGLDWPTLPTCP